MSEKHNAEESDTPTQRKLRAIIRAASTGKVEFETVIPQAILTLLIVGGAIYMTITGGNVPDWLVAASGAIIGFYFGSDYQYRRDTGKVK